MTRHRTDATRSASPRIAVIGASQPSPEEREMAMAVGRLLGGAGAVVYCGGRGGVMEAVARGVREGGGLTVGILPGRTVDEANPWIDVPVVTGLGEARNVLVVRSAQAAIAVGGGYGTLSEIAVALRLGMPVIGLRTWQLARGDVLDTGIQYADTPEEAVRMAMRGVRPLL